MALFLVAAFAVNRANARTFDFKTERLATYFGGSFGNSSLGSAPFGSSSGSGISTDQTISSTAGAEVGVLITGPKMGFRLGVELLEPKNYTGINGTNSSGATIFSLNSKVLAVMPMATLEFTLGSTATSKWLLDLGGGLAIVTLNNNYQLTTAGAAAYPSLSSNFTESGTANSTAFELSTGYEVLITDTVTLDANIGYRYIAATTLNSSESITSFNGAENSGSLLVNNDGSSRTINLSSAFVGVNFRFYLGL